MTHNLDIRVELQPNNEWSAIDRNTYDCDCDQDGFFSTSPVGYGATEQEAIADLLEQLAEDDQHFLETRACPVCGVILTDADTAPCDASDCGVRP